MTNTTKTTALLAILTMQAFTNSTCDASVSKELTDMKGAEGKTARVWKTLLPKTSAVKRANAAVRAIRVFHYKNTLAYMHEGPRILTTANYLAYKQGMRRLQDELEAAVADLADNLEELKTLSKEKLGAMYKEDDYPSSEELRGAYSVSVQYMPLPDGASLLATGMEAEEAEELKAELEKNMRDTFERANRKLWEDLYTRLAALQRQLTSEDVSPHDKTVDGLKSLVELLPRLNVTQDSKLSAMAERLKESLGNVTAGTLRTNPQTRQRVAADARGIQNVMSVFMAGRTGSGNASEVQRRVA